MKIKASRAADRPAQKPNRAVVSKRAWYIIATALAAIIIFVVALFVKQETGQEKYASYFRAGAEACAAGNYDMALSELRKAYKLEQTEECCLLMADAYVGLENYEKALEVLRTCNVSDAVVSAKILQVEELRNGSLLPEQVTVGGNTYPAGLTQLNLNNTGADNITITELTRLYGMAELSISGNSVTDITPLAQLGGLVVLDASYNQITDISALAALPGLRTVLLDGNPVTDISPLAGITTLREISLRGISLTREQLEAITGALPYCAVITDDENGGGARISFAGMQFAETVESLDLSGKGISDISALAGCTRLKELVLSDNSITELTQLMNLPELETLILRGNNISDLRPLMAMYSLQTLDISNNLITSAAPLAGLSALKELNMSGNPVSDFSGLANLSSLRVLYLDDVMLSDDSITALYGMNGLRELSVTNNSMITGEGALALKSALPGCNIVTDELVYTVTMGGQSYKDDITALDASGLGVKDLSPLLMFKHLETINLSGNGLRDLFVFQRLSGIVSLDLSDNQIEDITSLAALTDLEYLDLSNNYVSVTGTLINMRSLRELHIGGNRLTEGQIEELRRYLPECAIYTD